MSFMDGSYPTRNTPYDWPPSYLPSEQCASPQPLSPVPESSSEYESGPEEGQFSDALEESTIHDAASAKLETTSRRDSKIEGDFTEVKDGFPLPNNVTKTLEGNESSRPELDGAVAEQQPQISDEKEGSKPHHHNAGVLSLLIAGICLAVLLVSLDRTIITTAIPSITNEFHSTSAVGWYGSAYLVTACALQPTYGRIFTLFDVKWTFLHAVGVFELGSLICAIAPNSTALIVGRAIAGWGSAGILTGAFVMVAYAVPLEMRPLYTAAIGVMYGVGAAAGPILGGVFSGMITWRWCFYFNLPIGSVTMLVIAFFFKSSKQGRRETGFFRRLLQLDIVGSLLVLAAFVMLFLALEYNNKQYAWSSPLVIGLLCGFGATLLIFVAWQWYRKDRALIDPSILMRRTVAGSCIMAFFIYAVMLLHGYYLPIWLQAIKGVSTERSGVDMLPFVLPNAIFSLLTGIFVTKTGYFAPPAIIGCAIATAASGMLSTLEPTTNTAQWVGYVFLVAAGVGIAIQQSFTAVQAVLRLDQIPVATAAVTCFQSLGGAIFISIGNSILSNELRRAASKANELLRGIDIEAIIAAGATQFRSTIGPSTLPAVIAVYNAALQKVFVAAVPLAGLAFVSTLLLEWRSVKNKNKTKNTTIAAFTPATEEEEIQRTPAQAENEVQTKVAVSNKNNNEGNSENPT
ncbi:hypothetical protein VTN77DRAFT_1416 [Rasamsonia byssochlamydoides]|uniref:uncharacterized protein n=1 Tax=Rasamsonia byssochlamydoides TaxID=89139 RepID=UPI0037434832